MTTLLKLSHALGAGLFHRVIAQSGTANAMWATHVVRTPRSLRAEVLRLAEGLGCFSSRDFLDCLRRKPWDKFRATEFCEVRDAWSKNVLRGSLVPDVPAVHDTILPGNYTHLLAITSASVSRVLMPSQQTLQILGCNEVDPLFKPLADGEVLQRTAGGYLHNLDFPALPYMTGTVRAEFGQFLLIQEQNCKMWALTI